MYQYKNKGRYLGLTASINFGLARFVSASGENGYMIIVLLFACSALITIWFPILALQAKLGRANTGLVSLAETMINVVMGQKQTPAENNLEQLF